MIDILKEIVDKNEPLTDVFYTIFSNDSKFITAIELRFETFSVSLRAESEDDTISINFGELKTELDENLIKVSSLEFWERCINLRIVWGWQLINQQGYDDGIRLEFIKSDDESGVVVEFIVVASAIHIFSSARQKLVTY